MPLNLDLDENDSQLLNEGVDVGSAVRLPFEVPYLFVVNGDRKMAQVGGAHYFGGWATDRDELHTAGQFWDPPLLTPPSYMGASDYYPQSGNKVVPAYMTRSVIVSLIGTRVSWRIDTPDGRILRFKDYVTGAKRHMQMLVYLADKDENKRLIPWGPAVLTASGYQVGNSISGLQDWRAAVEKILRTEKSPASPWIFYTAIGTFGDELKQEMAGKPGAKQTPITPISVQVPKSLDSALLEKLYVGRQVAKHMAELKTEARDWLDAWKNLAGPQPDAAAAMAPMPAAAPAQAPAYYAPPPPPNFPTGTEDDIPF